MPCKGVEPLRLHVPLFFPPNGKIGNGDHPGSTSNLGMRLLAKKPSGGQHRAIPAIARVGYQDIKVLTRSQGFIWFCIDVT